MANCLFKIITFILLFTLTLIVIADRKPTRNVEITAEQEKLRDPEGFAAIYELHQLMDDDRSGSIDRFESADFMKEDLKIGGGSDRALREKAFHQNNDELITVDDLWEAWFQSEERDWNEQEVIQWLVNVVRLPQYEASFISKKVTGIALPRMATQNSSYIINVLGVKNFVHRQKLQLKALDLVLFGFQDKTSRVKDFALAALLILLVCVLIVFKTHKNSSKRQMAELTAKLSELKTMENDFEGAEQRLEEDRQRRQSFLESEHIEALKNQLMEAERRIEMNGYDSIPFALQPILRRTYELESTYINAQKFECLSEMREAKEFVDKMRRKQTGIMASFKIATGTTSGTDDIDIKIFALKARMEKIKMAMDECQHRWMEIESLCGFSITGPFGTTSSSAVTSKPSLAGRCTTSEIEHVANEIAYANKNNIETVFYDSSVETGTPGSASCQDTTSEIFSEANSGLGRVNGSIPLGHKHYHKHFHQSQQFQHSLPQQKLLVQQPLLSETSTVITPSELTFQKQVSSGPVRSNNKKLSDDSSSLSSLASKTHLGGSVKLSRLGHFFRRKLSKS